MIAALRCRRDELESDCVLTPNLLWRRVSGQQVVVQSRQCAERDVGLGRSECSEHDSRHRVSSRLLLGDEVEGRSPGDIGTPSFAVSEHLLELGFRDSEAVQC